MYSDILSDDGEMILSLSPPSEEEKLEDEERKLSVFDIFNDISNHGNYLNNYWEVHKSLPKEYLPFILNKAFSNFMDTIMIANEVNKIHFIPNEAHWRFLREAVTKRKRFSKWFKSDDKEPIELLAKVFNCSVREMQKNIHVIPKEKYNALLKELQSESE